MDVKGYQVSEEVLYTKEHEWIRPEGNLLRVGITDYAAKTLNDVVYVTSPKPNDRVERAKPMGTVESIKAVSEIFAPVSGVVARVNSALDSHPELINKSPYGEGWLVELVASDYASDTKHLIDPQAYATYLHTILKE